MILVTGSSGCIGRSVVERLTAAGHGVKLLWHWNRERPVPRRVTIIGGDVRQPDTLKAAMTEDGEVDTVIHLASVRQSTGESNLEDVNVLGTQNVIQACRDNKIGRLISVSCLGAEIRSPYPLQRSIGRAEEMVRSSGLNFTVLKSAVVYGEGDWLTTWISSIARSLPLVVPTPHGGQSKMQPIWVGDVAACIVRSLSTRSTFRQVVPIGGPASMRLDEVFETTLRAAGRHRRILRVPTSMTRQVATFLSRFRNALSEDEIESMAYNRTTEIGSVHRMFGFVPAKMTSKLGFLSPLQAVPTPLVQLPGWSRRS